MKKKTVDENKTKKKKNETDLYLVYDFNKYGDMNLNTNLETSQYEQLCQIINFIAITMFGQNVSTNQRANNPDEIFSLSVSLNNVQIMLKMNFAIFHKDRYRRKTCETRGLLSLFPPSRTLK